MPLLCNGRIDIGPEGESGNTISKRQLRRAVTYGWCRWRAFVFYKKKQWCVRARVSKMQSQARAFNDELGLVSPFSHTPRRHKEWTCVRYEPPRDCWRRAQYIFRVGEHAHQTTSHYACMALRHIVTTAVQFVFFVCLIVCVSVFACFYRT